ncbi:hypothetical protein F5X97DRAFT_46459 [Nemania serpens]|nr:hypothetical protein F5X97DRAFT_46459 [Nemania serpens]
MAPAVHCRSRREVVRRTFHVSTQGFFPRKLGRYMSNRRTTRTVQNRVPFVHIPLGRDLPCASTTFPAFLQLQLQPQPQLSLSLSRFFQNSLFKMGYRDHFEGTSRPVSPVSQSVPSDMMHVTWGTTVADVLYASRAFSCEFRFFCKMPTYMCMPILGYLYIHIHIHIHVGIHMMYIE